MEDNPLEKKYNNLYLKNEKPFAQGNPDRIIERITEVIPSGTALDLGSGQGRNAMYLAEHGFAVTARDFSEVASELLRKTAKERGLQSIAVEVGDAESFTGEYDAIVCSFLLHHINRDRVLPLIQKIKDHTNPGGVNTISTFSRNTQFFLEHPDTNRFYTTEEELRSLYSDWTILGFGKKEGEGRSLDQDGAPLKTEALYMLAQKPKS